MVSSKNKVKGFTLVELLIVIVVIAILAAISIVAYNGITQRARDTQRATDAGNLAKAIVNYNADKDGKWLSAADINGSPSALEGWKDPEVSPTILSHVIDSSGTLDKDHLMVELCGTSPNFTGAKVKYYKEADTSNPGEIKVGSC